MAENIYLYCYCRDYKGSIEFIRAYKYQKPKPDSTPSCSLFLYSEKSKRYHETYVYFMNWQGSPISIIVDPKLFRMAITRIGLDVR